MEFSDIVRRRHMVRAFSNQPVDPGQVDALLDQARRVPSAGNSQGVSFLVLEGPVQTARYWDQTLPVGPRREGFQWPGLVAAPVLVVVLTSPGAYVGRYGEPDKAAAGRGAGTGAWPIPYWYVDAGMAVLALLQGLVDAGLGGCFFGLFDHEPAVLEEFAITDDRRAVGTVALGHPAPGLDRPGRSAGRPRRPLDEVVLRPGPRG